MKAVRIHEYGGPEVLVYEEVPKPEPVKGKILAVGSLNEVTLNDLWDVRATPRRARI